MRFHLIASLFVLFSILTSLYSCQRGGEQTVPKIEVLSPREGFVLSPNFQMRVNAKIIDDFGLLEIELEVLNESMVRVSKNIRISVTGNEVNLDTNYTLSNNKLPSGEYFFRLKATNLNGNISSKFVSFQVDMSNNSKDGFLIYGISGDNEFFLYYWPGSGLLLEELFKLDRAIVEMRLNTDLQKLAYIEKNGGDLISLDINTKAKFIISGFNVAPWQYFTHFYFGRELLYVGFYNGALKGFGVNGVERYSSELINGHFPLAFYPLKDYLIVCETQKVGNSNSISTFFKASGFAFQSKSISFEFERFVGKSNESVFFIGKDKNTLYLYELFFKIGALNQLIELQGEELLTATMIGSNKLLAVFSDKIEVINITDNIVERNLILGEKIRHGHFNIEKMELTIVTENRLNAYKIPDLSLANTLEVEDVEFLSAFRL